MQKLLCDGRIRTVVERRGPDGRRTPLDLGRTRRVVSEKLFRALLLRDECCQRPGCGATTSLQAHHVRHWLFGGETNLGNLVLLCDRHHREHHEGRLQIVTMAPGCFQMRHLGLDLPTGPAPNRIIGPAPALEDDQEHVACDAARGGWDGERLDRRYAVGVAAAIRAAERVAREQQEPAA